MTIKRTKLSTLIFFVLVLIIIILVSTLSLIRPSDSASWIVYDQINRFYSPHPINKDTKFLVRDWEVWIGFNNVRYTIEAALLIAKILGRTLVLPAYTLARACQYEDQQCIPYSPRFIKGQAVDLNNISNRTWYPDPEHGQHVLLPLLEQEKGWVLPIEKVLDLDHIIATWGNAIRLEDFLKLTNPDPSFHSIGMVNGRWNTDFNLDMTYRKIPNALVTNMSLTMVDRLPKLITPLIDRKSPSKESSSPLIEKCQSTLNKLESSVSRRRSDLLSLKSNQENQLDNWDESLIKGDQLTGSLSTSDNLLLERCLASNGFRSTYGYSFLAWWMKAPYDPNKLVRRVTKMFGWWDEFNKFDEQILHIEGSIHNGFPPGSMVWTSLEGRQQYERLTRNAIRPPQLYMDVAKKIELKIRSRCGGRSWVGAHMRRSDFLNYDWAAVNITNQWAQIESHIKAGVNLLQSQPSLLETTHRHFDTSLEPPRLDDPFYLATDIRKPEEKAFLKTKNIILLEDVLDESDKSTLGFAGKFMDTLSVLEQCLMMRAGYFYGDAHSSVDGWVLNRRNFYGISQQVTQIDYLKQPGDGQ